MEHQNLIQIIEQLKQKIINDQNQNNYQINKLLDIINTRDKEIEYYKYHLSEIKNNYSNYNNYIDQIEHTCVIQNQEVERLEKEKEIKSLLNKRKKNTQNNKKNIPQDKTNIFFD